jgi:hypothetical protein
MSRDVIGYNLLWALDWYPWHWGYGRELIINSRKGRLGLGKSECTCCPLLSRSWTEKRRMIASRISETFNFMNGTCAISPHPFSSQILRVSKLENKTVGKEFQALRVGYLDADHCLLLTPPSIVATERCSDTRFDFLGILI